MEGILPLDYIDHHKGIDNYVIATAVNFPCIWLGVLLIGWPIRVLVLSRKDTQTDEQA